VGRVEGEDHPGLVIDAEQVGRCSPRVQEAAGGLKGEFVGSTAGVGTYVLEGLSYGGHYLWRLGTRSGGVIEIDHESLHSGMSLHIVPFCSADDTSGPQRLRLLDTRGGLFRRRRASISEKWLVRLGG
jgi:hypothetical protein